MSTKPLSAAGGAIRNNRKGAKPSLQPVHASGLIPAHEMNLNKIVWSVSYDDGRTAGSACG
ncbi:MAG: hypothetical protein ACR2IJ_07265 [Fluviibacter sp.]